MSANDPERTFAELSDMIAISAYRRAVVRSIAYFLLIVPLLISCGQSGREKIEFFDEARARLLEVRIWDDQGGGKKPLILLSHGSGDSNLGQSWLADSLAANGYMVVAVNHPFDTTRNNTPEGIVRVWDRPGDISYVLTELLSDPYWASRIDESRVGAAGFSSGGYTVIALAGAIFDPALLDAYCAGPTRGPDCDLARGVEVDRADAENSYMDERIRAVLAMAPAVGPGFDAAGLNGITVPVQIFAAEDDELVPPSQHARHYAQQIPGAELSMLPAGGHFVFLTCDAIIFVADLFISQFNLCGRGIDVDRDSIQTQVSKEANAFFDRYLAVSE